MDTLDPIDVILTRHSIRVYTAQPVSDELVEKLLKAAMSAPSAHNEQPWHFVVLRDRQTLTAITRFHPWSQMLPGASVAILICGDPRLARNSEYWIQDCSAAAENLLLAAHALGLGAVWLGIHPVPERVEGIRHLLGIPAEVIPLALISVGYPAEQRPREDRYRTERVHRDRW